jgi:hypothetical protein
MRPIPWAVPVVLVTMLLTAGASCADIDSPGMPQYANNLFSDFSTPTVRPGDSLIFGFNLTNPYDDPEGIMTNVTLTIGIYRYATQEETRDVDEDFERPPVFENGLSETYVEVNQLGLNESIRVDLAITTEKKTPHGSYFSQSTYFVRLKLVFNLEGNSTDVVLQSRGFFTEEEWDTMVSFDPDQSIVNLTYMDSLGIDGLIPDSSFGIKIPIPRWPLGVLIGGCCLTAFMALYYFVLDNPGKYPSLEKRFYKLRGKLRELRCKLEHLRRKR